VLKLLLRSSLVSLGNGLGGSGNITASPSVLVKSEKTPIKLESNALHVHLKVTSSTLSSLSQRSPVQDLFVFD